MRIAIVHDSFTQMGGAERVIGVLHEVFPTAPVYTLVLDKRYQNQYKGWDLRATWLQYFYNLVPKLQYWLFLIPLAVSSIEIRDADIVISSSSGFVKNIRKPEKCIHINYCHTPTRFLWIDQDYVKQEVPLFLRPCVRLFLNWMRKWDYKGAQRVTYFIANSKEVQKRVANMYHRTSTVVQAGIDTDFWRPARVKQDYFLVAGRLQAHKKIDWVIEIFNGLNLPLHVVGTGRQKWYLKSIARSNIKFLGHISDERLRDEYSGAKAFIYPQVEDFGLMPLEAAACGTATLALAKAGSLETVIPGLTGQFFMEDDIQKFKQIVLNWRWQEYQLKNLRAHAEKFSTADFKKQIADIIAVL